MAYGVRGAYKPTVGAAVGEIETIANGSAMTVRPAAGIIWIIEMISYGGACTIVFTDGTLSDTIDTPTSAGIIEKANYRISHDHYITVTNSSGASATFGYAGYVVNE